MENHEPTKPLEYLCLLPGTCCLCWCTPTTSVLELQPSSENELSWISLEGEQDIPWQMVEMDPLSKVFF